MTPSDSRVAATTDLSLEEAVWSARAGEDRGIAELYDRYAAVLFRLARRITESHADAEDVVHDLFVGLPGVLQRYEERGALEPFLKRVTVRIALMRLRENRRWRTLPTETAERVSDAGHIDDEPDWQEVRKAVASLPETLRLPVVLRHGEGYSHGEIAEALGIGIVAARVRYVRAIKTLRLALGVDK